MSTVVVARGGVGTINHTVLTVKFIESMGIKVKGIIINNYEDNYITKDNIKVIEKLTGISIVGKFKTIDNLDKGNIDNIRTAASRIFNDKSIIEWMEEL